MRRLVLSVFFVAAYGGVATAQSCVQPVERQAFDVIALKSTLMVSALSCDEGEQYDAFMTAFQSHIMAEQHVMDAFFRRAGGLAGQAEEDSYVTSLANAQSAAAIAQGAPFCQTSTALFTKVSALQADGDLDGLAGAIPLAQPISMAACDVNDNHLRHEMPAQEIAFADSGSRHLHHEQPAQEVTLADNQ